MANSGGPRCKHLVLDTGPLLTLTPLRGLAETYYTVSEVLAELKDNRARQHFEKLGLMSGVKVEVKAPDAASLAHAWAKKTGDYSVLSHPDLCILALTYMLSEQEKEDCELAAEAKKEDKALYDAYTEETLTCPISSLDEIIHQLDSTSLEASQDSNGPLAVDGGEEAEAVLKPLEIDVNPSQSADVVEATTIDPKPLTPTQSFTPIFDDPSDSDDGEGKWITPDNVMLHKTRAMNLLPDVHGECNRKKNQEEVIAAGCMTADFAMQNVLLHMGLDLVGMGGQRIVKVKSWVLRCHACFVLCKDNSKKFCPSCGGPTLIRTSVTVSALDGSGEEPALRVHLKPNFQYKLRGTKYSIPLPKSGSAKNGPAAGLILREDQLEYLRAKKVADNRRKREEAKLLKGILSQGVSTDGPKAGVSSWMDPDWIPEIVSVGSRGKGRTLRNMRMDGDMPQIGHGRRNPNEVRRRR